MKFIIDANIPKALSKMLSEEGFDINDVRSFLPHDAPDGDVYSIALSQQRTIITKDKHFGNILLYPVHDHFGVIILRTQKMDTDGQIDVLLRFLTHSGETEFKGALFILENDKYRKRT